MRSCARPSGPTATLICALLSATTAGAQTVLYVDPEATGPEHDGSSWCTAFVHLQDALDAARASGGSITEIRAANGIYQPDRGNGQTLGSRWATFQMVNGVALKGGYAGCGAINPDERNSALHESTLSGDLTGNDVGDIDDPSRDENSYQVVSADSSIVDPAGTVLDGFTITAGNADGNWDRIDSGGGFRNVGGSPTISNCLFLENTASDTGGAVAGWDDGHPRIINCIFIGNSADDGGGMWHVSSNPTIINCVFRGNSARAGGGVYIWGSTASLTNCTFAGNSAAEHGPAVTCDSNDHCCPSVVQISNSILWDGGDEVSNGDGSTITITHSDIHGGDIINGNLDEDPLFLNPDGPDAVPGTTDDNLRLSPDSPCIDAGDNLSVGTTTDLDGYPRIVAGSLSGTAIVDLGAYEYQPDCNGNEVSDAVDIADGTSEDCNDNGIPDECDLDSGGSEDQNGNAVPDECEGPILYVDDDANGTGNGRTWCDAYNQLQDALDATVQSAGLATDIHVAKGVYTPDQGTGWTPGDRGASFRLMDALTIKGGFAGCGADDPNERNIPLYEAILSGDLEGNDVGDPGDPSQADNSYHVVTAGGTDATAVLDGFTITAGNADHGAAPHYDGGGMHVDDGGRPLIQNCTFHRNAAMWGGGMYCHAAGPTLTHCTFTDNIARWDGGGMYNEDGSQPILADCLFQRNTAQWGGAVCNDVASSPQLRNCTFTDNTARLGAAMFNTSQSNPVVRNCLFAGNSAEWGGGITNTDHSNPTLISCAFSGNHARDDGGGLYNLDDTSPVLINCTFSGNTAGDRGPAVGCYSRYSDDFTILDMTNCILRDGGSEIWNDNASIITLRYSNVQGGWPGTGNFDADPMFVDPDGPDEILGTVDDDPRLMPSSPCLNTGDPAFSPEPDETDLDGHPRLQGCRVDLGAFESNVTQAPGDFDGSGTFDLADFAGFQLCYRAQTANPQWLNTCLCVFDFHADNDIDIDDFAAFLGTFEGP